MGLPPVLRRTALAGPQIGRRLKHSMGASWSSSDPWHDKSDAVLFDEEVYGSQGDQQLAAPLPSRILDHLYLGDLECARALRRDSDFIRYVLVAAAECRDTFHVQDGVQTLFLDIEDEDNEAEALYDGLHDAMSFINKAKEAHCRVLVHCVAGVSRSASIVIAYLILCEDMTFDQAFRFVQERKPDINPNQGFRQLLSTLPTQRHTFHTN